jgi:hypothetical protein
LLSINGRKFRYSRGHYWNRKSLAQSPDWSKKLPGSVKAPNEWHTLKAVCDGTGVRFFYDNRMIVGFPLRDDDATPNVKVGFSSHKQTVQIRRMRLKYQPVGVEALLGNTRFQLHGQ